MNIEIVQLLLNGMSALALFFMAAYLGRIEKEIGGYRKDLNELQKQFWNHVSDYKLHAR
jgi:hypothetical protein